MTEETTLPSHYDAAGAQERYYSWWEEQGYFTADPKRDGPAFSMVMPPPNVTGSLHMGHALNNTLPDILARYKRMDGFNVAWIPGADHASIAVHWVIERQLRAEKTDRHALGREAFLARAWQFKEETQRTITLQQRRLGVSCDWTRWRFTMDDGLSEAVRDVFVRLFEDGLIYRAERLVNWDPVFAHLRQRSGSDLRRKCRPRAVQLRLSPKRRPRRAGGRHHPARNRAR